jgi:hypothetical protein
MGAVLDFSEARRERRPVVRKTGGEMGQVIIFTGVRIERDESKTPPRGPAICSPPTRRKRANPSRIRNKA